MTPNFDGRQDARDTFRVAVRAHRVGDVELERDVAERLANRLVPVDLATATARAKLLRAVRGGPRRRLAAQPPRPQPAVTAAA